MFQRMHSSIINEYEEGKKDYAKRRKLNPRPPPANQPSVLKSLKVTQVESRWDKLILAFIVKGMHPISTVEQTEFLNLVKGNTKN